jgi:hypothetical protein
VQTAKYGKNSITLNRWPDWEFGTCGGGRKCVFQHWIECLAVETVERCDVDNWKNITNSQNSVRTKSFGGTFSFSNCRIIGLDTGSLVLIGPDGEIREKQHHLE